jgi:hypothetical protein
LRAPTAPSPEPRTQEGEEEEDGGNVDLDSRRQGKAVVLKTTTRQTIFLPVIGLVDGGSFSGHALHLLFFFLLASALREAPRRFLSDRL